MTFDRIDTSAEREAAVRMLCEGRLSNAAREAMSAAVTEYDERHERPRYAVRASLSGEQVVA